MLVNEKILQFSPTLEHQASVKMIETLLRDPEYKSMMRSASWNARVLHSRKKDSQKEVDSMVKHLEMRVNTLSVPGALKTTLKRCILYMTISTVQWLVRVAESSPLRLKDQYWSGTVYELMNHLQWNSFGYVDSQKTLESYISNRETIDFLIWNQLCLHCMENDIRRFSKTIEWEKCTELFFSALSVYWYRKIYNRSPESEMFQSDAEYEMEDLGEFEEKTILEHMFNTDSFDFFPLTGLTVSGIKYFRNYLNDDREFVKFLEPTCFGHANDDVIFYLLKTIKAKDIFVRVPSPGGIPLGLIDPLFEVPLILFIDDWMSMLETLDINWYFYFIPAFTKRRLGARYHYKDKLCEAFEKVWRIYYGKYGLDRELMGMAFCQIFGEDDVRLCKLMLKELEDHQRIHLIECGKDWVEGHPLRQISTEEELLRQILEDVLKSDQERELFSAIPKEISLPWDEGAG